jgi:cytochrome c biogenesis protein CcmG, thiol:disulfide interchange protein DsbE
MKASASRFVTMGESSCSRGRPSSVAIHGSARISVAAGRQSAALDRRNTSCIASLRPRRATARPGEKADRLVKHQTPGFMRLSLWVLLALCLQSGFSLSSVHALETGVRQPEIGLSDRNGKRIDLASLKGKVVLIDFWASWCAPCKQEMPVLERLYQKYKGEGLVIVAVSVDKESSNITDFLKQVRVSFPIVHDRDHDVADRFQPPRMPSSYIVDRKGIVRYVHGGFRSEDAAKLEAEIKSLLK